MCCVEMIGTETYSRRATGSTAVIGIGRATVGADAGKAGNEPISHSQFLPFDVAGEGLRQQHGISRCC